MNTSGDFNCTWLDVNFELEQYLGDEPMTDDISQVHKYRQGPCPKWNTSCALAVLQTYNGRRVRMFVKPTRP